MIKIFANPKIDDQWALFCKKQNYPNALGDTFMYYWPVIRTPWFAINLRKIIGVNCEEDLHNHAYDMYSFILYGGYDEIREDGKMYRRSAGEINRLLGDDFHAVRYLPKGFAWTISLNDKRGGMLPFGMKVDGEVISIWDYIRYNFKPWDGYRGINK